MQQLRDPCELYRIKSWREITETSLLDLKWRLCVDLFMGEEGFAAWNPAWRSSTCGSKQFCTIFWLLVKTAWFWLVTKYWSNFHGTPQYGKVSWKNSWIIESEGHCLARLQVKRSLYTGVNICFREKFRKVLRRQTMICLETRINRFNWTVLETMERNLETIPIENHLSLKGCFWSKRSDFETISLLWNPENITGEFQ